MTLAGERRDTSVKGRVRRVLYHVLHWVEHEQPTGVVHVSAEGRELGRLVVTGGRVCLATGPPDDALLDGVASHEPDGARLTALAAEAHSAGRRLGEALQDCEPEQRRRLREELLAHTARGLVGLAAAGLDLPRPRLELRPARDDYARWLAATPLEALLAVLRRLDPLPADGASRLFAQLADPADVALLLQRGAQADDLPIPIAVRGLEEMPLEDVVAMARAAAAMRPPRLLAPRADRPACELLRGHHFTWICFSDVTHLALLRVSGKADVGPVMAVALRLIEKAGAEARDPTPAA